MVFTNRNSKTQPRPSNLLFTHMGHFAPPNASCDRDVTKVLSPSAVPSSLARKMLGLRLGIVSRILRDRVAHDSRICMRCRRLLDTGSMQKWSSSSVPKDKARACDRGRMELLEVLEIRAQQLQVDEGLPLLETRNKKLSAQQAEEKQTVQILETGQRWIEKLHRDKKIRNPERNNIEILQAKPPVEPKRGQVQTDLVKKQQNKVQKKTLKADKDLAEDKDGNQSSSIQQNLFLFLETCIFLGHLDKAKQCLFFYSAHPNRKHLINVSMFNLLMKQWARKGLLVEIGLFFTMMEKLGLKPNLGSYAAALEAFGRNENNVKGIKSCLNQMKKDGISLEQLFEDLTYHEDERQMVLNAIHRVRPAFKPPSREEIIIDHPLVNNFYNKLPPLSYPKMDFTISDLQERFEEQLRIESCDSVTINSVEAFKPLTDAKIQARAVLDSLRSVWQKDLLHALQDSKNQLEKMYKKPRPHYLYPYLCVLEDEQYVEIMLQILTRIPPTGESFFYICRNIGLKIYSKFFIRQQLQGDQMDRIRSVYKEYCKLLSKEGKISGFLPRELWENVAFETFGGTSVFRTNSPWPRSLLMQLGTHLGDLLVKTIKMKNNLLSPRCDPKLIPVLYHIYSFRTTQQVGLIKPHPIYSQILQDAEETVLTFDAAVMPMKCPPLPWISPQFGPYLLSPAQLMRCNEGVVQHQLLLEKCPSAQLYPVLDAINQLGACPWRVNQPILNIIISIFNDKGNDKLDIPPPLSEAPVLPELLSGMVSSLERYAHQKELARCRKKASEMHSLRMYALYNLSIANHLRDQIFWFPHNMDFRGRTYPCPPYFNHLGSDVTRALLLFAEGHPLGQKGLDWLKIHLINLTGFKKKSSLQQRKEYADEIMEDILDSADHPLTGRKWWMETDEPWQSLACCMEIANAIRSPDPAKYISHFPVHQDGSCNGLQHYAALGRDEIGAKSVNLMPCDNPQDVYSEVAQKVEELRQRDAKKGIKIAQVLEGFIGRKIVKQTVMTVVYGVTKYGGRLQIEKRLRETDSFPQEYNWQASRYLVEQVFSSLKKMFTGTREIQYWLTESARMISKSGKAVEWVTPLGLPIVQPYHQSKSITVQSKLQVIHAPIKNDVSEKPDTMKQKNAFPPNFIHSLDSTHMMLTALQCYTLGLTFVSVHDCFWTHADTVDLMNKVCREQFVSLHSQPILKDLSTFMLQKYCNGSQCSSLEEQKLKSLFNLIPATGTFKLHNVMDSTYFFS